MMTLNGDSSLGHLFLVSLSLLSTVWTSSGYSCSDQGDGITKCRLDVVQDVTLERGSTNYNYLDYLLLAQHPGFPLKRSLLQFENLKDNSDCNIKEAFMYVNFAYAHKASYASVDEVPYVKHKVRLHVVNMPWLEAQATSTLCKTNISWSGQYLALDGSDAESSYLTTTTMNIASPSRFVEFKVTDAIQKWASGEVENNGLLMKVQDEDKDSRDLRFYSNAYADATKHAFINVICN